LGMRETRGKTNEMFGSQKNQKTNMVGAAEDGTHSIFTSQGGGEEGSKLIIQDRKTGEREGEI